VGIPTETVYGLAGWIKSDIGLRKIFSTKERPFFDPLIVHIDTIEKAKSLTSKWTPLHEALARACWPGPLTLIAKKNDLTSPLITSGLDSVGLRCPNHPATLELLSLIEGGLAAPSANKFGKTSPTSASHVYDEFKEDVAILDGGACEVGIESTVAGIENTDEGWKVLIYRPGFFTAQSLKKILKENGISSDVLYAESPVAPGQLKHHYMPNIPLIIVAENTDWTKARPIIERKLDRKISQPVFWTLAHDAVIASRELYENLRQFSTNGHDLILIHRNSNHTGEDWKGIWNRLTKAKTFEIDEFLNIVE